MYKNFTDIVTNVTNELQDTTTAFKALVKTFVNRRYFEALKRTNHRVVRLEFSITTVSGTQDYVLPEDFGKPTTVYDATNKIALKATTQEDEARHDLDTINSLGTVTKYSINELPARTQPTSAAVVVVVSSSTADTSQQVYIKGIVSGGAETFEMISLNGATPVNSANTYERITAISKTANTTGYITITCNSQTLGVLSPYGRELRQKVIRFYDIPASVLTINCPYIVKPSPMVSDYDFPVIDISDILEIGGKSDAWQYKRQFTKAAQLDGMFNRMLMDYIFNDENHPDGGRTYEPVVYNRSDLY